jgi:uncharacterized protein YyaL (SSP411 family)
LTERASGLFWDSEEGGFFYAAEGEAEPRHKEIYDGAVPSGNSVMFMNLLRLARLTGRPELEDQASGLARAFSAEISSHPRASTEFLRGLDYALGPSREVVVVGGTDAPETREFLAALSGWPRSRRAWRPAAARPPPMSARAGPASARSRPPPTSSNP